ncbi:MAG: class I SAM-dependent methyltransferase [Verrucomicrobiota bacterium]|jgi:SAM-dependent methyltransferase
MAKWPKQLPPLSPEDQRVNDDFMEHWHDVFPNKYSIADRWSHSYPAKHRPAQFLRTIEIGAGLGEHLKYEVLTPEQEQNYVAVEYRANMAKRLHEACPKIQTYLGDCQTRLDFPDGYFDRVLAVHVLEHLPNLPAAIREMYRLCNKTAGVFSIVIPCEGSLAYSLAREISAKRIFQKRYKRPYHIFISREHINLPWEVLGEIEPYFEMVHSSYFPIPLKLEFCNLFIGANYKPKARPELSLP